MCPMHFEPDNGVYSTADLALRIGAMPGVEEIYQIGSTAVSLDDCHSDTDLLIVCQALPSAVTRMRCYKRSSPSRGHVHIETFNLRSWEFGLSDSFKIHRASFCMMYYTQSELIAKVSAIRQGDGERRGFYQPTGFLNALATARLIFCNRPVSRIQRLFGTLKEYPEALRQITIARNRLLSRYFFEKISVGIARKDLFYAQQCLFHLREAALSMTFAMAGVYRVSDKRIEVAVADCEGKAPSEMVQLVRVLLSIVDYTEVSLERCVTVLKPLIREVEKLDAVR